MAGGDRPGPGVVVVATAHDFDRNQAIANARLIAAAPDLLAALRNLLAWASPGGLRGPEPATWSGVAREVCEAARAAIAKTEERTA